MRLPMNLLRLLPTLPLLALCNASFGQEPGTYAFALDEGGVAITTTTDLVQAEGLNTIGLCETHVAQQDLWALGLVRTGTSPLLRLYGAAGSSFGAKRMIQHGGTLYILGTVYQQVSGASHTVWARVDATTLDVQDVHTISASGTDYFEPVDMVHDGSGAFFLLGAFYNEEGHENMAVVRLAPSGAVQQVALLGTNGAHAHHPNSIQYLGGDLLVTGTTAPADSTLNLQGLLVKLNPNLQATAAVRFVWDPSPFGVRAGQVIAHWEGNTIHVAGSTIVGSDGQGPLLSARFNDALDALDHHVYTTSNFSLRAPLNVVNGQQVISGERAQTGGEPGVAFLVVDPVTGTFQTRSHSTGAVYSQIRSMVVSSGNLMTWATESVDQGRVTVLVVEPTAGGNACDEEYSATETPDELTLWAHPVTTGSTTFLEDTLSVFQLDLEAEWTNECTTTSVAAGKDRRHVLSLVPNPAAGHVTVTWNNSDRCTVHAMDGTGRVHLRTTGISPLLLDLGSLPAGVYVLEVQGEAHRSMLTLVVQ